MKNFSNALMVAALFPTLALAGSFKGKIVKNLTDYPMTALKILVRSDVDGGNSSGPYSVNADGTFTGKTSGLWRQEIIIYLPDNAELYVADDTDKHFKAELKTVSVIQLDEAKGTVSLKDGSDVAQWLSHQAPDYDLNFDFSISSSSEVSDLQAATFTWTKADTFEIARRYMAFVTDPALTQIATVFLRVRTNPDVDSTPLTTLQYKGPIARDMLSHLTQVVIDPAQH